MQDDLFDRVALRRREAIKQVCAVNKISYCVTAVLTHAGVDFGSAGYRLDDTSRPQFTHCAEPVATITRHASYQHRQSTRWVNCNKLRRPSSISCSAGRYGSIYSSAVITMSASPVSVADTEDLVAPSQQSHDPPLYLDAVGYAEVLCLRFPLDRVGDRLRETLRRLGYSDRLRLVSIVNQWLITSDTQVVHTLQIGRKAAMDEGRRSQAVACAPYVVAYYKDLASRRRQSAARSATSTRGTWAGKIPSGFFYPQVKLYCLLVSLSH
jgi:hypothetical protein